MTVRTSGLPTTVYLMLPSIVQDFAVSLSLEMATSILWVGTVRSSTRKMRLLSAGTGRGRFLRCFNSASFICLEDTLRMTCGGAESGEAAEELRGLEVVALKGLKQASITVLA